MVGLIVRGLQGRGHEVVCACVGGSEVEARMNASGVRTTNARPRGDLDLPSAWLFSRMLRREAPDALLLTDLRRMPWAAWAGRRARVPRVVGRLGLPKALPEGGPRRAALLRWVDRWYVPAEENAQVLRDDAPEVAGSIHVVPNGVEIPLGVEAVHLRRELGLSPEAVILAGAGAVAHRKGFDLLVRAVAAAAGDVHGVVAGDDGGAGAERALAETLGVADRVHFLGHRNDLPGVFAECDLFVLASRKEGSPPVLLEAIVAGAPAVVATEVAGVPAILGTAAGAAAGGWSRTPTGWLVTPDDGDALVGAVHDALALRREDRAAFLATGARARERVQERFSVERMVEGVEAVLFG
jgi:glycosyltransferase involved in cell wall biosynthesis